MEKGFYLGELEELVLLSVASLNEEAYSLAVAEVLEKQAGRQLTLSAIHTVLYRLEEKGYLSSNLGGATQERGGRRKRLFTITKIGLKALQQVREVRNQLWGTINLAWEGGST